MEYKYLIINGKQWKSENDYILLANNNLSNENESLMESNWEHKSNCIINTPALWFKTFCLAMLICKAWYIRIGTPH